MRISSLLILLASLSLAMNALAENNCNKEDQPHLVKPLSNWDIIAYNIATIDIAPYFSGSGLSYSISYPDLKTPNKVVINKQSGEITIDAQTRDDFNLQITASNACGTATGSFNVEIDEEE